MSTHSSICQRQKRAGRLGMPLVPSTNAATQLAFGSGARKGVSGPALMGFLIALLLSLFSISPTLASARQDPTVPSQQDLARAGVSLVRLLVSYNQPNQPAKGSAPAASAQCTGLGVLVGSGVNQTDKQQENWVLTDANLLDTGKAQCVASHPTAQLSSIELYMSSAYSGTPLSAPIATLSANDLKGAVHSQNGLALFPFHSSSIRLLPFVPVAATDTTQQAALYLSKDTNTVTVPPPSINDAKQVAGFKPQILQYLTPARKAIASSTDLASAGKETGMPLVTSEGELVGMSLTAKPSPVSRQDIQKLLQSVDAIKTPPPNVVNDNWQKGIIAYYHKQYADAQQAFEAAAQNNSDFVGAQNFAGAAQSAATKTARKPTPAPTPGTSSLPSVLSNKSIGEVPIWLASVVGLILLIAIVVVVSLIFGRSRARKRRLDEEFAQANRDAALAAQRMMMEEGQQRQQTWAQQPTMQMQPQNSAPLPAVGRNSSPLPPVPELRCPNCGEAVAKGTTRCPHCQLWLSPSESGIHMRLASPMPLSAPPPVRSVADQPTLVPSGPLADQPTVEMTPGQASNGQFDTDSTEQYGLQRWSGHNVALAVGTRTDRGIKRKHKPNEDSLFAAQGARGTDSLPLHVGLFVIADGMGGHANGQDASRKAIQTIIDFLLPKLMKVNEMQDTALERLLEEGVQHANQAVHQNNMEKGGDMGTTMTAALVVNATAYVANVGDSRTYLYREGKGLKKVTNDHSVVASLVEAGIIKPDDIYTHPKRNQIYRSLGEKSVVEVDTFTVRLLPGDKLVLCSDGLWDMVRDPKIEEVIKNSLPDPNRTAEALIQAALEGGGEDNVSVIVVSVQENAQQDLVPSFQLIDKPDSVQLPQF